MATLPFTFSKKKKKYNLNIYHYLDNSSYLEEEDKFVKSIKESLIVF